MGKKYSAIVGGYIRHEVYETVNKWLEDAGAQYERHIYEYNSEGYVVQVVSDSVMADDEVFEAANQYGEEVPDYDSPNAWTERPVGGKAEYTGEDTGTVHVHLGVIIGYYEDDSEFDGRYEM